MTYTTLRASLSSPEIPSVFRAWKPEAQVLTSWEGLSRFQGRAMERWEARKLLSPQPGAVHSQRPSAFSPRTPRPSSPKLSGSAGPLGKVPPPFHLERFPLHPLGKTLSGHPSCPPSPPGSSPGLPVTMPSLHPHHEDLAQLLLNSPIRGSTGVVVGWGQRLSQQRAHHSLSS